MSTANQAEAVVFDHGGVLTCRSRPNGAAAQIPVARTGYSDWHTITQQQIDAFAEATGDHQWIHVDRAKAARGPFGSTIAHGCLTLSLVPGANGYQLSAKVTTERQGVDKRACVVETVSILLP